MSALGAEDQRFKSFHPEKCSLRLMVRTLPFQGKNVGSIPTESKNIYTLKIDKIKKRITCILFYLGK